MKRKADLKCSFYYIFDSPDSALSLIDKTARWEFHFCLHDLKMFPNDINTTSLRRCAWRKAVASYFMI